MPKVKTNKTAAKRFKISGTGKMMFEKSRLNHLMMNKKRGGRVRRMNQEGVVCAGERNKTRRLLPNRTMAVRAEVPARVKAGARRVRRRRRRRRARAAGVEGAAARQPLARPDRLPRKSECAALSTANGMRSSKISTSSSGRPAPPSRPPR